MGSVADAAAGAEIVPVGAVVPAATGSAAGRPLVTVPGVAVGAADGAGNVADRSYEADATE